MPAGHPEIPSIGAVQAYLEVLGVFALFLAAPLAAAAFSLAGTSPSVIREWGQAVPSSINQIAGTALCIGVPLMLAQRRHVSPSVLGLAIQGKASSRSAIRMAAWAVLALIVGGAITRVLATGSIPEARFSYPNLTVNLFHSLQAGFLEEIVVLAFLVTTLEQARRPRGEVIAVALILRTSYHIYYGPGVIGVLVWASVFLWLYLRLRTVVPLIVVHSAWDIFATLAYRWKLVAGIEAPLIVVLFIVAILLWLVDRRGEIRPGPMFSALE